jgi:curved DNA-binding protein CbpA
MARTVDELARAYAILGLRPGAPLGAIRSRYRALAKRWHPDRYATDPQGQAEAAIEMRAITGAYSHLTAHLGVGGGDADLARTATSGPLSREQVDRMVQSIGGGSPVDWFFDTLYQFFAYHPYPEWQRPFARWARWEISSLMSFAVGGLVAALTAEWRPAMMFWVWAIVALACHVVLMRFLPRDAR